MPPDGPGLWPQNNSKSQWLVFYRINQMSLQGSGLIDGRGAKWWNLPCKPHKVFFIGMIPLFANDVVKNSPANQLYLQGVNGTTLPGPCDSPIVSEKLCLISLLNSHCKPWHIKKSDIDIVGHKFFHEHKLNSERTKNQEWPIPLQI